MSQKTKAQLITAINALYTDCGTECITVEAVNTFEKDKVDSYAGQVIDITKAALATAIANSAIEIGTRYRITDAAQGVIWVYGVDANVISTNAQKEGTWDGTTQTAGQFGVYDLANDRFISGASWTPTINAGSFDSATSIFAAYSVTGNVFSFSIRFEVNNSTAQQPSGQIEIPPPTGITLSGENFVCGVPFLRQQNEINKLTDVYVIGAGSGIQLTINGSSHIDNMEWFITGHGILS